jgi:hypothetical protein
MVEEKSKPGKWKTAIRCCAGNRIAEMGHTAYTFRQMKTKPKSIYLFLSSEKDFAAFSRILTKTRKAIETIDSVE